MSRYDYRTRRKLLSRHSSNPHKNFGAFQKEYLHKRRIQRTNRFLVILIILVGLIGLAVFSAKADEYKQLKPPLKKEFSVTATKSLL